MDYKQLRRQVAERLGRPASDVDAMAKGLAKVFSQSLAEMEAVAIPTFGTFTPSVCPDSVSTDLATGERILLPPQVQLDFAPGAMLLKRLSKNQ